MRRFLAMVVAFGAVLAHAEVLELEGTVKAVDATARSITIERKTPKGTKTLELEVTKKAGDLSSVKAGDSISFSYDPDLELVTKLGNGGGGGEAEKRTELCRITFAISDTGDCKLRLEKAPPLSGKTEMVKQPDGLWVCKHFFSDPADLDVFNSPFGTVVNARLDKAKKCLLFEAAPAKGFERNASQIVYPCRFRVPIEVSLDLAATGRNFTLQISPMLSRIGQRQALVNITSGDALHESASVSVASLSRDAQGRAVFDTPLVEEQTISFVTPWEKQFRLPIPNVRNRDAYNLRIGTLGESVLCVSGLTVSGAPVPALGLKLGEKDGVVFAEAVLPKSLAEKASLQSGDVVVAVRGKTPASVDEALDLLADLPFNEPSEITIQRGDSKKKISVTPTFGK